MRKTVAFILTAVIVLAVMVVCMSFYCGNSGLKGEDITFYEYHIRNGYSGQSIEYNICLKDSVVIASYKNCNMLMMRDDTIPCEEYVARDVPRETLVKIGEMLVKAKVQNWESYYTNRDVFDGDSWSMDVKFGKELIWSGGYMAWPDNDPTREINKIIYNLCKPQDEESKQ